MPPNAQTLRGQAAPGSGMTIDLFIDWPALSTHQSQNATFTFSQLRKYETIGKGVKSALSS